MKIYYPDVLASRYATSPLVTRWSPEQKVILERKLWVAVLKAQRDLGVRIPKKAIHAYEKVIEVVHLDSIKKREADLRHDVKARVEEFNALSGYELAHAGFTSRDLTDNVEQLQVLESLLHIRDRTVAVLVRLGRNAMQHKLLDICGRSHNVPAQVVTQGKRFSNIAEELLLAFDRLLHLIRRYPLRGIKGPMGTQQDMVHLLGDRKKASALEDRVRAHLRFRKVFTSVGQVYPRSLDFETLSVLTQLAGAPGNLAKMVRLMAGQELGHEGTKKGQVFSTAMPHKFNTRTAERVSGLLHVLGGYQEMAKSLVGDQWYEGDVSCSVVRRVALPGAFFALDGLYEATMTVLDEMELFPGMIGVELKRFLPFLSTTRLLVSAFKKGMGREQGHSIIKKHAQVALRGMRQGKPNMFVALLARDEKFPLSRREIDHLVGKPDHGLAPEQVENVCGRIDILRRRYPKGAKYVPETIL